MRSVHSLALIACIACTPTPPSDNLPIASRDTTASAVNESSAPADTGSTAVELRTDQTEYRSGGQVKMTIANRTDSTFAFNPCTRIVEREAGGSWVPVEEPGRMCTMEAWTLEPRASRSATTELPPALGAGQYRLVITLTRERQTPGVPAPPADRVRAVSSAFRVAN